MSIFGFRIAWVMSMWASFHNMNTMVVIVNEYFFTAFHDSLTFLVGDMLMISLLLFYYFYSTVFDVILMEGFLIKFNHYFYSKINKSRGRI